MSNDHAFTVNPLFVDRSNPSKLSDTLYLAGAATAREHAKLRDLGITAVVNLTPDDYGCADAGFKTLHIKIEDAALIDPALVGQFIRQMEQWEQSGETVLIHCHAGISRTSSFAIAWLMHKAGCNADSDLRYAWSKGEDAVGRARPIIMPHFLLKRAVIQHFEGVPA